MTGQLAAFCAAIVGASILGGLVPLSTVLTHTRLQLYLSFAAGTMLGAAFLHMLPEAAETDPQRAMLWAAIGLFAIFFLERFVAFHHHEAPGDPAAQCPERPHSHLDHAGHAAGLVDHDAPGNSESTKGSSLVWYVAAFGLVLHTLAGGVALASAAAVQRHNPSGSGVVWGVFLATLIHKPADALTIVSLMMRAGVGRLTAHAVNLGFSLMIPAGVLLFGLGSGAIRSDSSEVFTSSVLAFSAGTFLCIALSDLLPELQFHSHDRLALSLALLGGFALMFFSLWAE